MCFENVFIFYVLKNMMEGVSELKKYLENDHDLIELLLSSRLVDCFV